MAQVDFTLGAVRKLVAELVTSSNTAMDITVKSMEGRLSSQIDRLDVRIDKFETRIDHRFDVVDYRLGRVEDKLDGLDVVLQRHAQAAAADHVQLERRVPDLKANATLTRKWQ